LVQTRLEKGKDIKKGGCGKRRGKRGHRAPTSRPSVGKKKGRRKEGTITFLAFPVAEGENGLGERKREKGEAQDNWIIAALTAP